MTYQNLLLLHICCFLGAMLFFLVSFFLEPPQAPFVIGVLLMIAAVVTRLRLAKHRK